MIRITSTHLTRTDSLLIKKFCKFVLNKFVKRPIQRAALININVLRASDLSDSADKDDLRKYNAWCIYETKGEKKTFKIVLNASLINKNSRTPIIRLKKLLLDLAHELTHVKQYLNKEMFDYVDGGVRYKGAYFEKEYHESEELYYDSPWEIEAHGREWGLYKMFRTHLNNIAEKKE